MLSVSSTKITSSPSAPGWSYAYDFIPEDEVKIQKRGHLFSLVSFNSDQDQAEKIATGREIITRIHEEYYGNLETTAFNCLKAALEKVFKEFENFPNLQISAISLVQNVVYSSAGGGAKIYILRNKMLAKILESRLPSVSSASGFPKEGDYIILGNLDFFKKVNEESLRGYLSNGKGEESLESLNTLISSDSTVSCAALILSFSKGMEVIETVSQENIGKESNAPIFQKENIFAKLKGISNGFSEAIKKTRNMLPQRQIYLKKEPDYMVSEKKKTTFSVGIILLVLLVVSIGFGIRQKRLKDIKAGYQERLIQAEAKYNESINLFELDEASARTIFREAYDTANQILAEGVKDKELDSLIEKLNSKKGEILGEYSKEAQLFMDLSLLSSGFSGSEISYSLGNIYVLDIGSKKAVEIASDTKKTKVAAGPDLLSSPKTLAPYEDNLYVLEDDGIYNITTKKEKMIEKDWGSDVFLKAFAGNLYLLDKGENKIFRYQVSDSGFSGKSNWLSETETVDFSLVKKMAIDGSIWVLTSSGKIARFSLGTIRAFSLSSDAGVSQIDDFYTDDETESIYILSKGQKTIFAFDKDGNYKSQYFSEEITNSKDFLVLEKERKILILTGEKLLYLEI